MSIFTLGKTVIGSALAGMTLLALAANPTLADTHNHTASPTTAPSSSAQPLNELTSQTVAQTTQTPRTPQPQNQPGCGCCKNMMNNMQEMRNNMRGMMGSQNSPSK